MACVGKASTSLPRKNVIIGEDYSQARRGRYAKACLCGLFEGGQSITATVASSVARRKMRGVTGGSVVAGILAASRRFAAVEQEETDYHCNAEAQEHRDNDDLRHD